MKISFLLVLIFALPSMSILLLLIQILNQLLISFTAFHTKVTKFFLFAVPLLKCLKELYSSVQSLSRIRLFANDRLQHARLPCPSPIPRAYSNSCQSSRWCHSTISSSVVVVVRNPPANEGDIKESGSLSIGKIPWRREKQPTPAFLPGESHRQRNLAGYSPLGCKESDMTEATWHAQ